MHLLQGHEQKEENTVFSVNNLKKIRQADIIVGRILWNEKVTESETSFIS